MAAHDGAAGSDPRRKTYGAWVFEGVRQCGIDQEMLAYGLQAEHGRWAALARGEVELSQVAAEGLRHDSSVLGLFRTVTRDTTVGGIDLSAGDRLFLFYVSANHDAGHFTDPQEFRIDRANAKQHLSFGHGIHNCIGAPLARLELEIALELLAARYPGLRLADPDEPPAYKPFTQFRGSRPCVSSPERAR